MNRSRSVFVIGLVGAGVLAPALGAVADRLLTRRDSYLVALTDRRIAILAGAVDRYYEDTGVWPTDLANLHTRLAGVTSWFGSYLPVRFGATGDRRDRNLRDGWGRSLVFKALGAWDAEVYSLGPDGIDNNGAGDDRSLSLNADEILWRQTKREERVLNLMLTKYEQEHPSWHAPNSFESVHNQLLGDGYLPGTRPAWKRDFWKDQWGTKYEIDKNRTPPIYSNGRP